MRKVERNESSGETEKEKGERGKMKEGDLFYRQWKVSNPIGALYLIHGLGEHCGRYEHVARFLNGQGISVYSGDLPGFGRTKGRRGDASSFHELTEAVLNGWNEMNKETVGIPQFLLGHSMGGLVSLHLLITHGKEVKPDGVILSSPALKSKVEVSRWKEGLAKLLTPLFPKLTLPSGISPSSVTKDPEVVKKYGKDPYVHSFLSLRFYQEFNRTMAFVLEKAGDFPAGIPLMIMQAGEDLLVDAEAAKEFMKKIPHHSLHEYKEWPGLYHEILNEQEKEKVMEEMWKFIERVMSRKNRATIQKNDVGINGSFESIQP
ncbi:alpha/beta hydrolase [Thermicanus aegyptius]|uniref:alpha/beta hydrolase n=1 Tax=Thermicanus aegyptius TaxID=94009 RepID=UPI0004298F4D|nr:alpha/beta hydrolase [Thermicanus aegyptius]